ncbi:flagellar hook-associated protein FlgK [Thalassoglobus polymorphus]|uniref:Flagellar hook-associated protein 1 n=1 Tax=Thalassoglobus polymorphus TaxID=2527994 RepID=A0A517QPR6_9PLAN|nr:flagellar hook-associated protein FlgK [Thalassoglobus polymorphus]QDT33587.1 Flagellar hook-associated protein 1 [Thalassoglobus polymorphus]
MLHIDVGLSSIRASQQALYAISNNIANANTEGYHRQRVELIDRNPVTIGSIQIGSGVDVDSLTRLRDTATEASLISTKSRHAESETTLRILGQLESALLPSSGSLISTVSNFFNEIEQLAAQPSTVTIRDAVIAAAEDVVNQISQLDTRLNQLRSNNVIAIHEEVNAINDETAQIADLNRDIRIQSHSGSQPNTLLDQRDRLVSQLSERVDISLQSFLVDDSPLVAAGGSIIIAEKATTLRAETTPDGRATVQATNGGATVAPTSGTLQAMLAGQQAIDEIQQSLHDWANEFIATVDAIHASGQGQNSQLEFIQGVRNVSPPSIPLEGLATTFPVESGSLFVTLTESSTGQRTTHQVDIDVTSDSLEDALSRLDTIPQLTSIYQPDTGKVALRANAGYSIDFAGGIDAVPAASNLTGTASPKLSGFPTTSENTNWTATISGSGTVGTTPGLRLDITNSVTGAAIKSLDIGKNYLPGETLTIADGVNLSFTSGTVTNGENFAFDIVANPDETGMLVTLGLQSLFTGDASTGIGLNPHVQESPLNLAASRTGESADSSNLKRMIQLRESVQFVSRNETLEERITSLSTSTAFRIQAEQANFEYLNEQKIHLENVRDSVSGVDPNEELLTMMEYQRQFQAASRFITVVDEALDELLRFIN